MKNIRKMGGACAVVALSYVSEKSEGAVLRICKLCGFLESEGMADEAWRKAAKYLGLKVREFSIPPTKPSKFIRNYPSGLYFVATHDHIFVVDDGIIIDPRLNELHPHRTILQAWRVYV